MKTSKIAKVVEINGDGVKWRGVYYHSLEMENGDKINIGKKSQQNVGDELTYEILDTNQEYNKAKAVNPDFQQGAQAPQSTQSNFDGFTHTGKSIVYQVAFKEACAYFHNVLGITSATKETADTINAYADDLTRGMIENINKL